MAPLAFRLVVPPMLSRLALLAWEMLPLTDGGAAVLMLRLPAVVSPSTRAPALVRVNAPAVLMGPVTRALASRKLMLLPLALTRPAKSLAALSRLITPAVVKVVLPAMARAPLWLMAAPAETERLAGLPLLPMVKDPRVMATSLLRLVAPLMLPPSTKSSLSAKLKLAAVTLTSPPKVLLAAPPTWRLARLTAPEAPISVLPATLRLAPPCWLIVPLLPLDARNSRLPAAPMAPRLRAPPRVSSFNKPSRRLVLTAARRPLASVRLTLLPLAFTAPPKSLPLAVRLMAPLAVRLAVPATIKELVASWSIAPPALMLRLAPGELLPMVRLPRVRSPTLTRLVLPKALPLSCRLLASARLRLPARLTLTAPAKSLPLFAR